LEELQVIIGVRAGNGLEFVINNPNALEALLKNEKVLHYLAHLAGPVTNHFASEPSSVPVIEPKPPPPVLEPKPPPPVLESKPSPEPALEAEIKRLQDLVTAQGKSIIYIRERLDELCRYLGTAMPDMHGKIIEIHKEWTGAK
jgi:hypothetical protein